MNPATDDRQVPDIILERYRLNELPAAEARRLAGRLREDVALRARLEAIERSDDELRQSGFPARLAAGIRLRSAQRADAPGRVPVAGRRWMTAAALAAAAVVIVAVTLPMTRGRIGSPPAPTSPGAPPAGAGDDVLKGVKPVLTLFRKTATGSEALTDGSAARAGDLLRVAYRSAGHAYGVIVSIDGRGSVTLHLPSSGSSSARLRSGGRILLDQAYELDDAPRWEKFYLVTGDAPFEVAPILNAARGAAAASGSSAPPALVIAPGLDQASFTLTKEGRS